MSLNTHEKNIFCLFFSSIYTYIIHQPAVRCLNMEQIIILKNMIIYETITSCISETCRQNVQLNNTMFMIFFL
jgi:hypothetical protein